MEQRSCKDEPVADAQTRDLQPSASRWVRGLWLTLGLICVALAAIGVVLPGLPTTPFLVLAAACFLRSSRRLYERVLANPTFGPAVRAWRETGTIPAATKWTALGTMACFVAVAVLWAIPAEWPWVRLSVLAGGVVGALFLLRLPTPRA
ncbi:MAG TPA: YbaN family protein [Planctomycetota bacterium]|nr:YbaN family protein [Planctomycetota bacterium]